MKIQQLTRHCIIEYMLFAVFSVISLEQHIQYFNFRCKIQLDHPVSIRVCVAQRRRQSVTVTSAHLAAVRQPVASEVGAHAHVVLGRGEEGGRRAVELLALLAPLVAAAQILVRREHHVDLRRPSPLGHIHCQRNQRHSYFPVDSI